MRHMNYRVYFNRHNEFPTIWSVDEGGQDSEINVKGFRLHKVNAVSVYDASIGPNPDVPCAWIEIEYALMDVKDGIAHFFHDSEWRDPPLA